MRSREKSDFSRDFSEYFARNSQLIEGCPAGCIRSAPGTVQFVSARSQSMARRACVSTELMSLVSAGE